MQASAGRHESSPAQSLPQAGDVPGTGSLETLVPQGRLN